MPDQPTLAEIIDSLTWEQITSDGIITLGEVEAMLRAKGVDPDALDYLYDCGDRLLAATGYGAVAVNREGPRAGLSGGAYSHGPWSTQCSHRPRATNLVLLPPVAGILSPLPSRCQMPGPSISPHCEKSGSSPLW